MPERWVRMKYSMVFAAILGSCLSNGSVCRAHEAHIGSNADGACALYKITFSNTEDVTLEQSVRFAREGKHWNRNVSMIAMRPETSMIYLFAGPEIVMYDLDTRKLERRVVIGGAAAHFMEPAFFSSSGRYLYVFAVRDNAAGLILNPDTLDVVSELPYGSSLGSVYATAFTSEETALYVAKEESIVQYPVPSDGTSSLDFAADEAAVVAELPAGTTHRLFMEGDSLWVNRQDSSGEDDVVTTDLTKLTMGTQLRFELKGQFLSGCERDFTLCSFDRSSETIFVYEGDGTLRKKILAVLTELLSTDEVEVAHTESGEEFTKLVGVRAYGDKSPRFHSGYMSPDGRFAVMVFGPGIRGPSYVSVVDISEGTMSPAIRVGKVDGGVTNVVFRD